MSSVYGLNFWQYNGYFGDNMNRSEFGTADNDNTSRGGHTNVIQEVTTKSGCPAASAGSSGQTVGQPWNYISFESIGSNYSRVWWGWFVTSYSGTLWFQTASDDSSLVYVSEDEFGQPTTSSGRTNLKTAAGGFAAIQQVVDNNGGHGRRYRNGNMSVVAGKQYFIRIYHGQGGGGDNMHFSWNDTGTPAQSYTNTMSYVKLDGSQSDKVLFYYNNPVQSKEGGSAPVDVSLGIVSWYDGASFDTTNNKWVDKAGSFDISSDYISGTISKKSQLFDSVLISNRNNKRYNQTKFPVYLSGSKNSGITFNKDASYQFLTDGSYTFFHAARRDPSDVNQTGRVFDGSGGDWYSGFNDASSGVAKHENDSINTIDKDYGTNWVVSVDTPKYYRSVGYSDTSSGYYETSSGNRTDTNTTTPQISIHYGSNTFQGPISTGGIITNYSNYCISTFLSSGTLSVSRNTTADFLIVGGGGGGGGQTHIGGGGGAGGVVIATNQSLAAGSYNVNVGNGGGIYIAPNITNVNGISESYNNGDDYTSYTFINSGTFTTDTSTIIDFILVGGGGGGASEIGGGGGGGGVIIGTSQTINSGTYNITIGTGGNGANNGSTKIGSNGSDTTFNGFISKGGGGGGYYAGSSIHALDGGSGGGCGANNNGKSNKGDSNQDNYSNIVNITGYGNDGYGGGGNYGSSSVGGGGGGAGTLPTSEDGGDGISNDFKTGNAIYYGGGGGGGGWARNRGLGGLGGGGNSDTSIAANGDDGVDGLGGGGGGGGGSGKPGGDGGSGIVIIRVNTSSSGSSGNINGSDSTFNGFVAKGGGAGGTGNYIDAINSSDVSGGTESQYSIGNVTYQLHSFTQTGDNTLTITKEIIADFMLVGGGGGGSGRHGGGGGGGVVIGTNNILSAGTYNIRIGSGGLGGDFADIDNTLGFDGSNTELSGNVLIISKGGGGGGGGNSNSTPVILNANPTLAGSITSTGWNSGQSPGLLQGVAVDDERNLAFVSDWGSKFFVINTTNKSSPQHIGYITDSKLNQSWMPVYDKARKHVFVSTYTSGGIVAINVVNPATPSIVSEIKNQTILGGAHVIQFDSARNLVYVCGYNANAIVIVDVSNLNNLTISGYIQGTTYTSGPLALDYDSVRELVFSINYGDGSLTIIDVSNKTTPTVISKTTDSRFARAWGAAYDVERKLLFVPRRTYNIIHIIDVTNTSSPTFRGSYDDGASYLQNPYAIDFDQNRKLLYLTSYSKNGIVIVSTSDPDNPTRIGWLHDANSMSGATGLDFNSKEDIICVSGKNGSDFAVIDINQPPFLNNTGTNGGSGGGGTYANSGGSAKYYDTNGLVSNLNGGSATVSTNIIAYGNDGGVGQDNGYWPSGGGGGAGGVGGSPSTNQQSPGDGGIGIQNNFLTNSNIYYAGGGGASSKLTDVGGSSGGSGGGGDGKAVGSGNGGDAIANTGGGGGAGGGDAYRGGHGGSGYAVVRFAYNDLLEKGDADNGGSGGGGGGNYLAPPPGTNTLSSNTDTVTQYIINGLNYQTHIFTGTGNHTLNITSTTSVDFLLVGGGGGGGMDMGGGGGGGGIVIGNSYSLAAGNYTISVGNGGTGGPSAGVNGQPSAQQFTVGGQNGGDTTFASFTAKGGGYGGSSYHDHTLAGLPNDGGCGGGPATYNDHTKTVSQMGVGFSTQDTYSSVSGVTGYGQDGGNSQARIGGQWMGGGGGGAGQKGITDTDGLGNSIHPDGGYGIQNNFYDGTTNYYWGGGGGSSSHNTNYPGSGGLGGGGGGGGARPGETHNEGKAGTGGLNNGLDGNQSSAGYIGGNGGDNTGGGGGGGPLNKGGGDGGSGIVIIRFVYSPSSIATYPGGNDGTDGGSSSQDTYSSITNVTGYGNSGGGFTGIPASEGDDAGGGGGGAGGVGDSRSPNGGGTGNGGIGIQNDFRTNSLVYYAGGGGGGSGTSSTPGTGGSSLGGSGSNSSSDPGSAIANSGSGGGGGNIVVNGGNGADGIVVVRLTETPPAQQCDWNVGEVISYNRILDISDENKVFDYLKHRYLGTGQSTTGEVYQLPGDVSGGATIRGFPPEFPDTNNILGWYIPESYDASGFWRDVTPFQNDLSSGGTAPEYVKNDKTYTTLSYLKGVKADSDNEIVASGYKFPEQFLPSDGSYTMIHVSRRISNTGRIFDSASNKNFYSGFVGNKSGVALHSIDVSSGGGGGPSGGISFTDDDKTELQVEFITGINSSSSEWKPAYYSSTNSNVTNTEVSRWTYSETDGYLQASNYGMKIMAYTNDSIMNTLDSTNGQALTYELWIKVGDAGLWQGHTGHKWLMSYETNWGPAIVLSDTRIRGNKVGTTPGNDGNDAGINDGEYGYSAWNNLFGENGTLSQSKDGWDHIIGYWHNGGGNGSYSGGLATNNPPNSNPGSRGVYFNTYNVWQDTRWPNFDNPNMQLVIGNYTSSSINNSGHHTKGIAVYSFRVWHKKLTQELINKLYNAGHNGRVSTSLTD